MLRKHQNHKAITYSFCYKKSDFLQKNGYISGSRHFFSKRLCIPDSPSKISPYSLEKVGGKNCGRRRRRRRRGRRRGTLFFYMMRYYVISSLLTYFYKYFFPEKKIFCVINLVFNSLITLDLLVHFIMELYILLLDILDSSLFAKGFEVQNCILFLLLQ